MRRAFWFALVFALGFAVCHVACRSESAAPVVAPQPVAPTGPPRVLINRPNPADPSKRITTVLVVHEMTRGGLKRVFRPVEQQEVGGPLLTPDLWMVDADGDRFIAGLPE